MLDDFRDGHQRRRRWLLSTLLLALASGCGTAPDQIQAPAAATPLAQPAARPALPTTSSTAAQPAETNTDPDPAVATPLEAPFEPSGASATDSGADPDEEPPTDALPPTVDGQAADAPPAVRASEHDNFDLFEVVIDRYRRTPDPHRDPQ